MVYPTAEHPSRTASRTELVTAEQGSPTLARESELLSFKIKGISPAYFPAHASKKPRGGGVGVATGLNCQIEMILRVVGCDIGRKGTGGAVLEALVHRQNHQFTGTGKGTVVHQTRQVGEGAGVVRGVPRENLFYAFSHRHIGN